MLKYNITLNCIQLFLHVLRRLKVYDSKMKKNFCTLGKNHEHFLDLSSMKHTLKQSTKTTALSLPSACRGIVAYAEISPLIHPSVQQM